MSERPEVVVITGASAGVGRATARAFARRGAHIGLLARGKKGLAAAQRDVERLGGRAIVLPTDVACAEEVEAAATATEQAFGPIDVWINNAMVSVFSPVSEMLANEYRRVTEVTYLGFVHGTLAALRRMRPRDRGTIVEVGSALAYRGIPLQSAYCAAKHAIQGFSESLRCELIHEGSRVRVTMVNLPAMNTPQFKWCRSKLPRKPQPVPPIYEPEVAADAIVHAAHHYRREWWIGGSTAVTIALNKFLPGVGDYYLGHTGYSGQQYDGHVPDDRPDNLWEPVDGDYGARGSFTERAHDLSWQVLLGRYRHQLAWLGAMGLAGLALCRGTRKRAGRKSSKTARPWSFHRRS